MARRICIVCLSLAFAGVNLPVLAQDGLLEDLYGRGVHAYFEHRYEEAHGLLTKAITSGLKDPRAYYFRGLTNLRLGRPDEAKAEFATGAEYEAAAAEPVNIGKALERIQGAERLAIEQHRRTGRLALHNKAAAAAKARYEERIKAEERVLLPRRGPRPVAGAVDESDPFNEGGAKPEPLPTPPGDAKPAPSGDAVPPAEVKPAEPKPAEAPPAEPKPATADPFAEEPKPATPAPAPKPAVPAAEGASPPAGAAAEPPRGSLLGSLFRAAAAGGAKALAGDDAAAEAKPAPAPAAPVDPNVKDPFAN